MANTQLSAAAINASLQVQPALANLNFDFSLWKVTAPKEFEGLGALFERLLPQTPKLIKAYGQRASEISQLSRKSGESNSAYGVFSGLIATDDDKIHHLRKIGHEIARELSIKGRDMFIRYRHHYPESNKSVYEYATVLPWTRETSKRKRDESFTETQCNRRWLYASGDLSARAEDERYSSRLDRHFLGQSHKVPGEFVSWHSQRSTQATFSSDRESFFAERDLVRLDFENCKRFYSSQGEDIFEREKELIEDFAPDTMGIFWDREEHQITDENKGPWYRLMYGDESSAAIYVVEGLQNLANILRTSGRKAREFYDLFEKGKMDTTATTVELFNTFCRASVEADPYLKSLKAVSTAARMYRRFSDTSVDVRVLQQPLYAAAWVRAGSPYECEDFQDEVPVSLRSYRLNREMAFACITMFESGKYDIDPTVLKGVMAMSSEDTIYVGRALVADPSESIALERIVRILGNIGRSGIAFLVPPLKPLIKDVKMSDWPKITHEEFDGGMRDSFQSTSLHLSFTGASTAVNVGFSGGQDIEVYMLETLISVRDGRSWIADLDVFKMFKSLKLRRPKVCEDTSHKGLSSTSQITAIDNWLELIDAPEDHIRVVRAHKNWQARLAATTISIAIGFDTLVMPDKVCWCCFDDMAKRFLWDKGLYKVTIIC